MSYLSVFLLLSSVVLFFTQSVTVRVTKREGFHAELEIFPIVITLSKKRKRARLPFSVASLTRICVKLLRNAHITVSTAFLASEGAVADAYLGAAYANAAAYPLLASAASYAKSFAVSNIPYKSVGDSASLDLSVRLRLYHLAYAAAYLIYDLIRRAVNGK